MHHDSICGAIARSLCGAAPLAAQGTSFIPPWWPYENYGDLVIGWGKVGIYPGGEERLGYLVERHNDETRFYVRAQILDANGYPLKSSAIPVMFGLTQRQALYHRHALQQADATRFFDIFPQDI
jgi:hypothetical protein